MGAERPRIVSGPTFVVSAPENGNPDCGVSGARNGQGLAARQVHALAPAMTTLAAHGTTAAFSFGHEGKAPSVV